MATELGHGQRDPAAKSRAMKLVYSDVAIHDLARLRAFIAEHDPASATRVADDLLARVDYLRQFPLLGRMVDAAPEPKVLRDAIFGKYIIRYSTHPEVVVILRVWHHFEDRSSSS